MPTSTTTTRDWPLFWAGVYIANLPVPLLFASDVTRNGGRVGMAAAIGLGLAVGLLVVPRVRWLRGPVVVGGLLTALSQPVILLQLVAGGLGLAAVERLGLASGSMPGPDYRMTELGGFVATLLTGGQLLAVAWASGAFIRAAKLVLGRPPS